METSTPGTGLRTRRRAKVLVQRGLGVCKYGSGNVYKGSWADNKRNGKGTMEYANGNVYAGDWQNDRRRGKGTCDYASGAKYEGDWDNDKRNGNGSSRLYARRAEVQR